MIYNEKGGVKKAMEAFKKAVKASKGMILFSCLYH